MSKLYYRKSGDVLTARRNRDLVNGVATIMTVEPGTEFDCTIRTEIYDDKNTRQNDDFLYLPPSPSSLDDRVQGFTTPTTDGNVNLSWTKYPNIASVNSWRKIQNIINENKANAFKINYDTLTVANTPKNIIDSLLINDHELFLHAFNVNVVYVYNFLTDTYRTISLPFKSYGYETNLLPNGKVKCESSNNETSFIFDPSDDSITLIQSHNSLSAITLSNGKVLNAIGLYDFISNTYENLSNTFLDMCMLPNGNVFLMAFKTGRFGIYNGVNITEFGPTYPNDYNSKCLLLPDEKVLLIPSSNPKYTVVDTNLLTFTENGNSGSGTLKNRGGILLMDGTVFISPNTGNEFYILNPETFVKEKTFSNPVLSNAYGNCLLLPNGKIFISGFEKPKSMILSASDGIYGDMPDLDALLSVYINR